MGCQAYCHFITNKESMTLDLTKDPTLEKHESNTDIKMSYLSTEAQNMFALDESYSKSGVRAKTLGNIQEIPVIARVYTKTEKQPFEPIECGVVKSNDRKADDIEKGDGVMFISPSHKSSKINFNTDLNKDLKNNNERHDRKGLKYNEIIDLTQGEERLVENTKEEIQQFFEFDLLDRHTAREEVEKNFEIRKKDFLEKLGIVVELHNLDRKIHKMQDFLIEYLFTNTENNKDFYSLGHSERIFCSEDYTVKFPEKFYVNFLFGRYQYIRIIIYSRDFKTSELTININKVVTARLADCKCSIDLLQSECLIYDFKDNKLDKGKQHLVVKFNRRTANMNTSFPNIFIEFQFIFKKDSVEKLCYVIYVESYSGEKTKVYKSSEVVGKGFSLKFPPAAFGNKNAFLDREIKYIVFEFYNPKDYYGQVVLNRQQLDEIIKKEAPLSYPITNENPAFLKQTNKTVEKNDKNDLSKKKGNNHVGKGVITYKNLKRKMFLDNLLKGMTIKLDIAIDFTISNKIPKDKDSLHTFDFTENKYVHAIKSCSKILREYNFEESISFYGFGGVGPKCKEVSHCFNINGNLKDPVVKGIDEVIKCYEECLKVVTLVGPTYFQQILKASIESIKKEKAASKKVEDFAYHIFLILTDGKIDDMVETKNLLIEAAKLPVSVIIIGIGNGDFGKMESLGK